MKAARRHKHKLTLIWFHTIFGYYVISKWQCNKMCCLWNTLFLHCVNIPTLNNVFSHVDIVQMDMFFPIKTQYDTVCSTITSIVISSLYLTIEQSHIGESNIIGRFRYIKSYW